jgi:para-aminobenzoate synthetase component 1
VIHDGEAVAAVGGRYLTGLSDLTSDLAALDSRGLWVVVLPFDGQPICARFDHTAPQPDTVWRGPHPEEWSSSLDAESFKAGVEAIRVAIADGNVYQVNLCRVLTAPTRDNNIMALADVLREGNPAPYAAAVRIPPALRRNASSDETASGWSHRRSRGRRPPETASSPRTMPKM